jgi:hypothetical protein
MAMRSDTHAAGKGDWFGDLPTINLKKLGEFAHELENAVGAFQERQHNENAARWAYGKKGTVATLRALSKGNGSEQG